MLRSNCGERRERERDSAPNGLAATGCATAAMTFMVAVKAKRATRSHLRGKAEKVKEQFVYTVYMNTFSLWIEVWP